MSKVCTQCGEAKPLEDYSPCKTSRDKLQTWCKRCKADRERERRRANPEVFRARDRERYIRSNRAVEARERRARNREHHRAKDRAYYWANRDKKRGQKRRYAVERVGKGDQRTRPQQSDQHYGGAGESTPCSGCPSARLGRRPGGGEMSDQFDATNSVRLCDRCEAEQGVAAGADKGDRACAACGQHEAPHIYPQLAERDAALARVQELEDALKDIAGGSKAGDIDGAQAILMGIARRALANREKESG